MQYADAGLLTMTDPDDDEALKDRILERLDADEGGSEAPPDSTDSEPTDTKAGGEDAGDDTTQQMDYDIDMDDYVDQIQGADSEDDIWETLKDMAEALTETETEAQPDDPGEMKGGGEEEEDDEMEAEAGTEMTTEGKLEADIEEKIDETLDEKLDERLDGVVDEDTLEAKLDETRSEITEAVAGEVGDVLQKAETGATPSPTSGGGTDMQASDLLSGGDS